MGEYHPPTSPGVCLSVSDLRPHTFVLTILPVTQDISFFLFCFISFQFFSSFTVRYRWRLACKQTSSIGWPAVSHQNIACSASVFHGRALNNKFSSRIWRRLRGGGGGGQEISPSSPPPPSLISQPVVFSLRVTFDSLQPSRASSPRWQQRRIIQRSRSKSTSALQANQNNTCPCVKHGCRRSSPCFCSSLAFFLEAWMIRCFHSQM